MNKLMTLKKKLLNPARLRTILMGLGLSATLITMAAMLPRKVEEKEKPTAEKSVEKNEGSSTDINNTID